MSACVKATAWHINMSYLPKEIEFINQTNIKLRLIKYFMYIYKTKTKACNLHRDRWTAD